MRNLRIREDTAKYLLNLDPNSAHYDPKSRSMREDPQPHKAKKAFAGDNFVRKSGDYHAWEAERLHQLAAYDHGASLHMQAAPSQAEILHQHFKNKKGKLEVSHSSKWLSTMLAACICTFTAKTIHFKCGFQFCAFEPVLELAISSHLCAIVFVIPNRVLLIQCGSHPSKETCRCQCKSLQRFWSIVIAL